MYVAIFTCAHMYYYVPVTFNTTLLVMVEPTAVQLYTALLSFSVTLVIIRSVNPPVVELNT